MARDFFAGNYFRRRIAKSRRHIRSRSRSVYSDLLCVAKVESFPVEPQYVEEIQHNIVAVELPALEGFDDYLLLKSGSFPIRQRNIPIGKIALTIGDPVVEIRVALESPLLPVSLDVLALPPQVGNHDNAKMFVHVQKKVGEFSAVYQVFRADDQRVALLFRHRVLEAQESA